MDGEMLAWGVAVLATLAAAALWAWHRSRLRSLGGLLREAERRAAEAAGLATENRQLASRLAASEAEVADVRGALTGLSSALDRLPVPVWRRRSDLALADCNQAYAAAVESDRPTVLREGRTLGGAALAERLRGLAELARQARTPQTEAVHVVIAGARRLLEVTEAALGSGGTIGIALDVTEREELQAEHKRHLVAHREVLENLSTAIAVFGPDTGLKFFNTAFARLWRFDPAWLAGEPDFGEMLENLRERRLLPEYVDFPAFKRSRIKLFTSLLEPLEELVYIPDGTTLRTHITPHPLGGLMFAYEDVTDNLALERSYNTLIAVQRATLDNLYEGIAVIGGDGRIKLHNPAFARMWGLDSALLTAEPHVGELVERLRTYFDVGDNWSTFKDRLVGALTERNPRAGRLHRADNSTLDYASVPLPDGAVLLSYLDVTDSVRVEQALRVRNEALETADRLKSEFISNVSYELRTPLNTIIGFAEILSNQYFGKLSERQLDYCRGIMASSERLLTIINDILDLASIEAGRMALEPTPIEPRSLLEKVASIMQESARARELRLAVDCPPGLAPILVDERRLKQALCNLVSNAIRYTPGGGSITLAGEIENGHAVVSVRDTGVGIPAEDRERVLGPFERGRAARGTARGVGAGLGLSLVKRIVELHGGRLIIDSLPNHGTTVSCVLPLGTPRGTPGEATPEGAAMPARGAGSAARGRAAKPA